MANPPWPTSLPDIQYPAPDSGYQRQAVDPVLSTAMDVGPPKERRRSSAVHETVSLRVDMDEDQLATVRDFYESTLQRVNPFDWIDHYDRTTATYVFTAKPQGTPLGLDETTGKYWWSVQLQLRMVP